MARFYPSTFPPTGPSSERRVWRALEALDDAWLVFHSVAWQAPRAGREGDGEADFVLLHARHGLLVLEVKGGGVELAGGSWFSTDRHGTRHAIRDPFRQAVDSKHALLRYLQDVAVLRPVPAIAHAVVLPDVTLDAPIGMNPREIVVDGDDLRDAAGAVSRAVRHWSQWQTQRISDRTIAVVIELLAPTVKATGLLRADIAHAERQILALTEQQIAALSLLRNVRRCAIRGGAGTGKTVLAVAKARRVALEGGRALLVCFNAPLAGALQEDLRSTSGVTVSTFHSLCVRLGRARGGGGIPQNPDDAWYETRAADVLADAAGAMKDSDKYDVLVVDEAQDLTDEWLTALTFLLRSGDEGPVLLLLDSHQQIYRQGLTVPASWPVFELDRNCRNTLPIARRVAACFRDPMPSEGATGPEPSLVEADDGLLASVVHDVVRGLLVDEHLDPRRIVVLSNQRKTVQHLRQMSVATTTFVEPGAVGVLTDTIHRFKGLDAETVVLAMAGRPGGLAAQDVDRALVYVGASRARSALFVVGTQGWIQWFRALATS